MKKCWDPNPKNRPTTEEVYSCFEEYYIFHKFISEKEIKVIKLREAKHLEIIKSSGKFLLDKHRPESFFTNQPSIKLIKKASSSLNELANNLSSKLRELNKKGDDKLVELIGLSNEVFTTLRIVNFCIDCEKNFSENNKNDDLTGALKRSLNSLEINIEEKITDELSGGMSRLSKQLSRILCDGCQREKFKRLINKYGDKELTISLGQRNKDSKTIKWIPFNELENIENLAEGGFGVIHKARWVNYHEPFFRKFEEKAVVLKKLKNSMNYTKSIFKEVK